MKREAMRGLGALQGHLVGPASAGLCFPSWGWGKSIDLPVNTAVESTPKLISGNFGLSENCFPSQ